MTKPTALQVAKEIADWYYFHENGSNYDINIVHVCEAFIAQTEELKEARAVIEYYSLRAPASIGRDDGVKAREFLAKYKGEK